MKFIKANLRYVNVEQIVSIGEDGDFYILRMSNADAYKINKKANKKVIEELLNADIQLPSKRTTKGADRDIQ